MNQPTFCPVCQQRQKRGERKTPFLTRIRRAIVPRLDPIRKAVTAAAASDFAGELRLVILASLLAGAAVVYLLYMVTSLLK